MESELTKKAFRKGYPGHLKSTAPEHENRKNNLSSYYRAGRYVGIRGHLMEALNALLPPRKIKKLVEETVDV
jgi:hypothetical protein